MPDKRCDIQRVLNCEHQWKMTERHDEDGYAVYACACGLWAEAKDAEALPKKGAIAVDLDRVGAAGIREMPDDFKGLTPNLPESSRAKLNCEGWKGDNRHMTAEEKVAAIAAEFRQRLAEAVGVPPEKVTVTWELTDMTEF